MDEILRARSFLGWFSHMQGAIREWNVEKLEGGGSQILVPYHLHAVKPVAVNKNKILSTFQ